jgi:Ca2+/Na+ antiporter
MVSAIFSLALLLLFSEFASANLKRLAPILEAWDQAKRSPGLTGGETNPFPWLGGWEKLAALFWAFGVSIPLLAFTISCHLFLADSVKSQNLILGATMGSNIIGLSLAFGFILLSGPLTFFRLRTVTSPVFLLLATVIFTYVCLNRVISIGEAFVLLVLLAAYVLYFRRFSSEWKYYERTFSGQSLLESAEGILPVIAVFCMGIGFFLLAILVAYPFVKALGGFPVFESHDSFRVGAHFVAFLLALPWLGRCLYSLRGGSTPKAITMTSISHACLLNVLFLPALGAFLGTRDLSNLLLSFYLPALLLFTGVFVSALLFEKEKGGKLPWVLVAAYMVYTALGTFY